jgi:type II secretory pathway pseudopilin PulG
MKHARGEQGATIIESMVAAALFATTAAAVYPMFSDAKKVAKQGDIRKLCQSVVRAKLDEYRFGKPTRPAWAANPNSTDARANAPNYRLETISSVDKPQLNDLTVPARTATQVDAAGAAMATNGFTYAKVRYNRYYPAVCNGESRAKRLNPVPTPVPPILTADRLFGMRECIGTDYAWVDTATTGRQTLDPRCNQDPATTPGNDIDRRVSSEIPGFKLYVKLERTTAWGLPELPAASVPMRQYDNNCPNFGGWRGAAAFDAASASSMYDFNGDGDGIRITVTGVMDTEAASPSLRDFAGIPAGRRDAFLCSAQSSVFPETFPVRYYLSTDGRIYPVQGTGGAASGATTNSSWVFRSLYSGAVDSRSSGITSFAVHPRNHSLYVLRPGSLTRYGNCGGSVIDCVTTPGTGGVSDRGRTGWANVQEYRINPGIRYLGVDFRTGALYGMMGDRNAILRINISCLHTNALCGAGTPAAITYTTVDDNVFPRRGMSTSGRLTGFFVAPGGDDAFVSDYSTSVGLSSNTSADSERGRGATSYSSSVYRSTDTNLLWPIARLPVAALTFSK